MTIRTNRIQSPHAFAYVSFGDDPDVIQLLAGMDLADVPHALWYDVGMKYLFPRGAAHPDWIGDAVSIKGGRRRAARWFPVIGPCVRCGALKAERHHIDGNTANNDASNIEALCRRCHMEKDGRLAAQIASARDRQRIARAAAATAKLSRVHCKNGHVFEQVGWLTKKSGARMCKECVRGYQDRYRAKRALQCR